MQLCILIALIDIEKEINSVSYQLVIEDLADMYVVPGWLLSNLISYLNEVQESKSFTTGSFPGYLVLIGRYVRGGGGCILDFRFFSLYFMAWQQTFPESQLLEAWPASIYGHLREWTFLNQLI